MKPLRNFNEFVKEGIVKKQSPDKSRVNSLKKESKKSYNFLIDIIKKIGINNSNANNIIKNAYDIIMELIRAKMLLEGFNSSGLGAHEAEVAYLRILNFSEKEIQFANQLRYFRNGITYYGKSFDEEYARKVIKFLESIHKRLK
ncbi:MAG: hypothetical protein KKH88_02925 [Nanoarchaeota archaeon]|nr:hypothetical protein [Nanoarchaeota archaeon]MBU1445163.1 hypothetical protein [Nanoarchaeota archaeon]MBU2420886.1 hypothetical protein [Nanoarchaeota archaeon]MBU2475357.1 hypothetical protein [Nanoarchaeota archaeon]MBU3940851.1 hypothetical protein [Nanoarchaeota archaeon]